MVRLGLKFMLSFLLSFMALADAEVPKTYGIEIEFSETALDGLISNIDYQLISETSMKDRSPFTDLLKNEDLNDYLRLSPQAFQNLPQSLRDELTEGLDLNRRVISGEGPKLILNENQGLQGFDKPAIIANDKPAPPQASGGFILPQNKEAVEADKVFDQSLLSKRSSGLEVPNTNAWEEVYKRWENLDLERKRAVINLNYLPLKAKTKLYTNAFTHGFFKDFPDLPFPKKAPEGRAIIPFKHVIFPQIQYAIPLTIETDSQLAQTLSRMSMHQDLSMMEFIHDAPVDDLKTFKNDVRVLASWNGISSFVNDPGKFINSFGDKAKKDFGSIHIHIGNKNLEPGGKYDERLLRAIEHHFVLTMANENRILYDEPGYSIIRDEGKGIEIRDLPENFDNYMSHLDDIMSADSTEDAIKAANTKISQLATKRNLTRLNQAGFVLKENTRDYLLKNGLTEIDMDDLPINEVSMYSNKGVYDLPTEGKAKFIYQTVTYASPEQLKDPVFFRKLFNSSHGYLLYALDPNHPLYTDRYVENLRILLENDSFMKGIETSPLVVKKLNENFPDLAVKIDQCLDQALRNMIRNAL